MSVVGARHRCSSRPSGVTALTPLDVARAARAAACTVVAREIVLPWASSSRRGNPDTDELAGGEQRGVRRGMAAKNVNYKWYQYTDDTGRTWSMKVSKNIGENASWGFGALDTTDPVLTQNGRSKPRQLVWIDPNTGRMTRTPVGTNTATIWTTPTSYTSYGLDTTTDIVYSFYGRESERIAAGHTIVSKPEPA